MSTNKDPCFQGVYFTRYYYSSTGQFLIRSRPVIFYSCDTYPLLKCHEFRLSVITRVCDTFPYFKRHKPQISVIAKNKRRR